jgi:hypothetical protein
MGKKSRKIKRRSLESRDPIIRKPKMTDDNKCIEIRQKRSVEQLIAFEDREDELRRRRRAELIASGENPDVVPLPRGPQG